MYPTGPNDPHAEEKEAWREGYAAGREYHLEGDLSAHANPHCELTEQSLHNAWESGFDQAGDDS